MYAIRITGRKNAVVYFALILNVFFKIFKIAGSVFLNFKPEYRCYRNAASNFEYFEEEDT